MTRCADASERRAEPLVATASRVDRWLLVEHRGSWGPQAPPVSRLTPEVARALAATAATAGARLLMIRRPVRQSLPGRWVFAADSRPDHVRLLARHLDDGELDLPDLFGPAVPAGWDVVEEPLWLVCTQGRHDLCCAVRGRPVATAMVAEEPERVWEASHVGGDRFAANVVLLPEGHYFGRVTAEGASRMMREAGQGQLDLATHRGRSSLSLPIQAAQAFARAATGRAGTQDLAAVEQCDDGPDQWRIRLIDPDVEVVVRYVRDGSPSLLTCDADRAKAAPSFVQVSLTQGLPVRD